MVQCTGCHELFTTKGYQTHIRLTTNHNCAAIYTQGLLYIASNSGSESSDNKSNGGDSGDLYEPAAFPGGFFGDNYSRADFEGLESDSEGDKADEDVANAMHEASHLTNLSLTMLITWWLTKKKFWVERRDNVALRITCGRNPMW
jgi:hypothetical protein